MSPNPNHIQQGDVLIHLVTKLPKGCKVIKDPRGAVLAEGEHTGHYHGCPAGLELLEAPTGRRYVRNATEHPVTVRHQEHHVVTINPGEAGLLGQVVEKDWFADMVRPVID